MSRRTEFSQDHPALNSGQYPSKGGQLYHKEVAYFCSMLAASKHGSWDFPGGLAVKIQASTAGGACSIPGLGTKITHVTWGKKTRKNFESNKKETIVYQLKVSDGKTNEKQRWGSSPTILLVNGNLWFSWVPGWKHLLDIGRKKRNISLNRLIFGLGVYN